MKNHSLKLKNYPHLIFTLLACWILFLSAGLDLPDPKRGFPAEVPEPNQPQAALQPVGAETVCKLIYQGRFDEAGKLLSQHGMEDKAALKQFTGIISEYNLLMQKRETARQAAYRDKLAELEKFKLPPDVNDVNDVNDPNNITKVLSVIAQAVEFADDEQKNRLLSDVFVQQTIQKAVDRAAELEAENKWLDAYLSCYSWLQAIDKDNQQYADYSEQLLEKANIVASFQDSPCETSSQRYAAVNKKMFIRAVDVLNFNYVTAVDYGQMAAKALRRSKLLAEVIAKTVDTNNIDVENINKDTLNIEQLKIWSGSLGSISNEVEQSLTGVSKDKFLNIFEKVLELNLQTVQLPEKVLIVQFAEAALSALDLHTSMIWPMRVKEFEKEMTNEFTGIGIEITKEKGLLTVASLLPDTPAYNSGLDAGDIIEKVDGLETRDMSLTCAVRKITGPKGTNVTLTVRHLGTEQTKEITITRARITVPTLRGWQRTETGRWLYMIDKDNRIGYVRLTGFSEKTAPDLDKVLTRLESKGLNGLILDLRFNTGGYLSSAAEITDKFIKEGLIVSTRPRFGLWTYQVAHRKGTHPDYPLVILINSGSASASEIVAGALADPMHERAVLVGDRTHGKGSVQTITSRPGSGAKLKYTMAYYHLPSGQRVESQEAVKKAGREDWGVGPDVEIKLRSDELKEMLDIRRDNDVLVQIGHNGTPGIPELKKHSAEKVLEADPQLAVGVLLVKTKNLERQTTNLPDKSLISVKDN